MNEVVRSSRHSPHRRATADGPPEALPRGGALCRLRSMRTRCAVILAALVALSAAWASAQEGPATPEEAAAPAPQPAPDATPPSKLPPPPPPPAEPAGPTDVVVMAAGTGDVTEEALSQARSAVVSTAALQRSRHERTVRPERDPALSERASTCPDDPCLTAVGRDAEAAYLFVLRVERAASAHSASVMLVDVDAGSIVGSAALELPGDPAGFVDAMREPMGPLLAAIPPIGPTTGTVILVVDQDGAAVMLDGERVGTSPMPAGQIEAGDHALRVTFEGYEVVERTLTVERGGEHRLEITLVPLPEPEPEPLPAAPTPVWQTWWFWTAIGGAVAIGAGLGIGLGIGLSGAADPEPEWGVPFPSYGDR